MLMLPGLPFVYYGEEIGMRGAKPDEQIRTPMQWSSAPGAGFTTGTPWQSPQSDWAVTNVQAQDGDAGSLLNHYRRLIHLRHEHSALNGGDLIVGSASDPAIATFVRRSPTETILVVLNFGARVIPQASATLSPGSGATSTSRFERIYEDPTGGCAPEASAGANNSFALGQLAPYGFCVFRLSTS
jgi:glycosidase